MDEPRKQKQVNFLLTVKERSVVTQSVQKKLHETEVCSCVIKSGGAIYKITCASYLYMCSLIRNLLRSLQRFLLVPAGSHHGFSFVKALRNMFLLGGR